MVTTECCPSVCPLFLLCEILHLAPISGSRSIVPVFVGARVSGSAKGKVGPSQYFQKCSSDRD